MSGVGRPGRPRELEDSAIIHIVVERQTKKILERISWREHKSISELLRPKVEAFAKAHATGNDQFTLESSSVPGVVAMPTLGEPVSPEISDDALEDYLTVGNARIQEARAIAKKRRWWVEDKTGAFERVRKGHAS